ncbi:hypothetical protein, partial [Chromobacterium piscinae]|uniref:hypothetical protein n=1 Tax=Chromobacterium piscinae TaxID=686831 RepID=UPI003260C7BB
LHLSVIRSVKEQCWPLRRLHRNRFVSAVSFAAAFAKHLHLSVIRSVKEQCWPLRRHHRNRFVSAVSFAASAEEANYTPAPLTRQHLLREKLNFLRPVRARR